jgi:HlyD family secretion protein
MKADEKKKKLLFRTLGACALIVLVYMLLAPKTLLVESAAVTRGVFREVIRADGILRSKKHLIVQAAADGDIKRIDLEVGDSVSKGQAVTQLFWDTDWDPVRSPITGVISRVFRESAGPVRRGDPLVEVLDPAKLEVRSELLTTDAVRVSPGAPVTVEGWGDSSAIPAKVVRISKAGFTKVSALGVEEERTEVTMDPAPIAAELLSRIGSTFHVDVTIQVSEKKDALKAPTGAIFRDGDGWAVYVVDSGRARLRKVVIASLGSPEVMIASGLAEGDRVVVYPGDLVKDGSRLEDRAR